MWNRLLAAIDLIPTITRVFNNNNATLSLPSHKLLQCAQMRQQNINRTQYLRIHKLQIIPPIKSK